MFPSPTGHPCNPLIFLSRKTIMSRESDVPQRFARCILKTRWSTLSALLVLAGLLALVLYSIHSFQSTRACACPAPLVWDFQRNQAFVQRSQDEFSLKNVTITSQEFHFFYAYTFSHPGFPSVTTTSHLEGSSAIPLQLETRILETRIQPLGVLGNVNIGVIHARLINRPHQIIELHITPPGESTRLWKLAPLKQMIDEPHPGGSTYGFEDLSHIGIPTIAFYGPVMMEQVAYFNLVQPVHATSQPAHIFLRMDHPLLVSLITQEQYLAIAGPENYQQ